MEKDIVGNLYVGLSVYCICDTMELNITMAVLCVLKIPNKTIKGH